jgi:hypothetical protein
MSETDEDLNKGRPYIRVWDIDENSTRYDKLLAAPSDDDLHKYWSAWSGIALAVGFFTLTVFFGILSSHKVRQNSFNVYLMYLMIPDILFSLLCGVTCLLNAINGEYWSSLMCNFQQWYCVFGIGANAWLNAVITFQLHTMLKFGNQRRRYTSPTRKTVTAHALSVYLFVAFLGTWGLIGAPWWPFHSGPPSGLACLPIEVDRRSTIFFWSCFFPLFAGIPIAYVAYVCYDIWKRNLLPPMGRRRYLAIYFGRLILVFLVMWLPTLLLLFVISTWLPPWAHFAGGTWSHLQGALSAGVSLLKPDIYQAVKNFVTCQFWFQDIPMGSSTVHDVGEVRTMSFMGSVSESFFWSSLSSPFSFSSNKALPPVDNTPRSQAPSPLSHITEATDNTSTCRKAPVVVSSHSSEFWPNSSWNEETGSDPVGVSPQETEAGTSEPIEAYSRQETPTIFPDLENSLSFLHAGGELESVLELSMREEDEALDKRETPKFEKGTEEVIYA